MHRSHLRFTLPLVAALGTLLLFTPTFAQAPPAPPARFAGAVTINGQPAAQGTAIEARIGGTTCGTTTTFTQAGQARYVLDSPASQSVPNCGADGATVTFFVAGTQAQTGQWLSYQLNTLDLSVSTQATTVPTQAAAPSATPKPPDTGSGSLTADSDHNSTLWLFMVVAGAVALAAGFVGLKRARMI